GDWRRVRLRRHLFRAAGSRDRRLGQSSVRSRAPSQPSVGGFQRAMRFTSEHELFRQTVRDFVGHEINPHVDAWEQAHSFPAHELFPKLAEIGLIGLEYDPADGGQGADHWYTVIFGEELGR